MSDMTIAIIGAGNIGSSVARHLVGAGETVVVAAKDSSHADALAEQLGPRARASSVEDAIAEADVVVFALWLDDMKVVIPQQASLLDGKVVIDPSNPIGFDETGRMFRTLPEGQSSGSVVASLLPAGAHYVKAFGTLGAGDLAAEAGHESRTVLFYATDDDAAEAVAQRLIRTAGFEPLKVGGVSDAGRIEGPDGDLQGKVLQLDEARAAVATEGAKA
jgi:8-hydroxy-5-deazaflavin:NADPH oxidoreductase